MSSLFPDVFGLPIDEKIRLLEELWDSIGQEADDLPIPSWQKVEIQRRKERFEQDPSTGRAWEDVEHRLREKYGPPNHPSSGSGK